jgi:lipopolysaccharide biosynthesis protein
LHIHYPDTLPYFIEPIERLGMPVDLYVTTTGRSNRVRIEAALLDYERGSVSIAEGPNRGRDIGPFMTLVGDMIGDKGYDLIGHFHGKKSLSSNEAMGRNWRDFLLGTLLGEPRDISRIFGLFAADEKLGLVFAEDRHAVGWSENRPVAELVATRMQPRPNLCDFSVFPLGNMFWARPDAIKTLWSAGFHWDDYPIEPIRDDGTMLHAVERMLPTICESVGMRWATVYKKGLSW